MTIGLRRVGVRIGGSDVLSDITLDVDARTIALIGENGSGKSTLARLIGGLIRHTTGEVSILGLDPRVDAAELRKRVALVFSNPDAQIIMPSVREDVAFSLRSEKLPRHVAETRVLAVLERFGLQSIAERSSHDLSGGQKQLLALCGAFVREPDLVVADEPTAYLDARNASIVANHLLAEHGHTLLLVTHDLSLAARCETAVLVAGGSVSLVGPPAAVIDKYRSSLRC